MMTAWTEPYAPFFVSDLMIGRLSHASDVRAAARTAMLDALAGFRRDGTITVISHFDADGLSAAAILVRALGHAGRAAIPFVIGKTESPWDPAVGDRISSLNPAGLIVADLGARPDPVLFGCPTLVIDHHVPCGSAPKPEPRSKQGNYL